MDERRKNAMDDRHPQDEEKPISRRNLLGAVAAGVGISALAGCETVDDGPETGSRAQSLLGDIPHLDKLREIDKARFVDVVTNGYQGQVGVMPAWKENPNVMKWLDHLYAYLMARTDGVIPAGRLERFDR